MLESTFCFLEFKLFPLKVGKEFHEYSLHYNAHKDKIWRAEVEQTQDQ